MDVIDRKIGKDGVLRSHRLMSTEWGMPSWISKVNVILYHMQTLSPFNNYLFLVTLILQMFKADRMVNKAKHLTCFNV